MSTATRPPGRVKRLLYRYWAEPERKLAEDARQFWSGNDGRRRDLSHWAGEGRWADRQQWRAVGESHFLMYRQLQMLAKQPACGDVMLEWGPGGGANVVRFRHEFSTIYGVDISAPNLEECKQQAAAEGFDRFHPILFDVDQPESVLDRINEPINFLLCTAVYQHFPSVRYGNRVTKTVAQLLAPKALAIIQTRYSGTDPRFFRKFRDYRANAVTFTSYDLEDFRKSLVSVGLEPLGIQLHPKTQYAFYLIRKG